MVAIGETAHYWGIDIKSRMIVKYSNIYYIMYYTLCVKSNLSINTVLNQTIIDCKLFIKNDLKYRFEVIGTYNLELALFSVYR